QFVECALHCCLSDAEKGGSLIERESQPAVIAAVVSGAQLEEHLYRSAAQAPESRATHKVKAELHVELGGLPERPLAPSWHRPTPSAAGASSKSARAAQQVARRDRASGREHRSHLAIARGS